MAAPRRYPCTGNGARGARAAVRGVGRRHPARVAARRAVEGRDVGGRSASLGREGGRGAHAERRRRGGRGVAFDRRALRSGARRVRVVGSDPRSGARLGRARHGPRGGCEARPRGRAGRCAGAPRQRVLESLEGRSGGDRSVSRSARAVPVRQGVSRSAREDRGLGRPPLGGGRGARAGVSRGREPSGARETARAESERSAVAWRPDRCARGGGRAIARPQ